MREPIKTDYGQLTIVGFGVQLTKRQYVNQLRPIMVKWPSLVYV